jgi:aminopeptidase YwaD
MQGELTKTSIQPKDYPFYFPDEHREVINALEGSGAEAILTVTGQHPVCGLSPFYFFEDGNFLLPSAYIAVDTWEKINPRSKNENFQLHINSQNNSVASRQIIARKAAVGTKKNVMVCAHMDSKYGTPAALDNAAGLALMVRTMDILKDSKLDYNVEFVPYNSEEYFGATAELIYLEDCKQRGNAPDLVINIDSPGHIGSKIAVSGYNTDPATNNFLDGLYNNHQTISGGPAWYSGDHAIYAMNGVPCIAVASSDFYEGGLISAHTEKDTLDTVDCSLLEDGAIFLAEFLKSV